MTNANHIDAWLAVTGCLLRNKAARTTWRVISRVAPPPGPLAELITLFTGEALGVEPDDLEAYLGGLSPAVQAAAKQAWSKACSPLTLLALHSQLANAELCAVCRSTAELLQEAEPDDATTIAKDAVARLSRKLRITNVQPKAISDITPALLKAEKKVAYLPSFCKRVSQFCHGYPRRALSIVAARSGHGKTWWLVNEALSMASVAPGLFVSREMPAEKIALRMLAIKAQIEADLLQSYRLGLKQLSIAEIAQVNKAAEELNQLPIIILDGSRSVEDIVTWITELAVTRSIAWVCVDYLQLLSKEQTHRDASTRERVSAVSDDLTHAALDNNVAVIAASQLRRPPAGSNPEDTNPTLNDLKESSDIEEDATVVLGLNRIAVSERGFVLRVEILKNREGRPAADAWEMQFENRTCQIRDYTPF